MNDETKKKINERYEHEVNKGERFWPDSIYKDLIVSFGLLIILILLAAFVGVGAQPKVDPNDTSYIPRPEWYFLFLFKFLALYGQIPVLGKIEWIATVVVPGIGILLLALMPFIERSPERHYSKRAIPISAMSIVVVDIVLLTLMSDVPTVSETGSKLPGILQAVAGLIIPGLAFIVLFLLAYVFKNFSPKPIAWLTIIASVLMVGFTVTVLKLAPAPVTQETTVATTLADQILAGQDLYLVNCAECHGEDGSVAKITGVKGLEGKTLSPINGSDVLHTLDDASLAEVIASGRPNAGMNPFGKAVNPQGLSKSEIDYIVTFMRYSWDDRFQMPAEALKPLFPPLADGEVPSYEVHIQPIVKRYCLSCHRAGKENNNFLMDTYANITTTGDHKANDVIAGDANSYLLQVIQGHAIMDPNDLSKTLIRTMPPNAQLKPNSVDAFVRWVMAGMPETAADAAKLSVTPMPGAAPAGTPAVTPTP